MSKRGDIRLLISRNLDAQHKELANIFLLRDPRVKIVQEPGNADFCIVNVQELSEINPLTFPLKRMIVLDFGDLYAVKVGLRHEDGQYRSIAKAFDLTFIYLEGENCPVFIRKDGTGYLKELDDSDDRFIKLSIPLGYPAGGKMNLNYRDDDTAAHHINNSSKNEKSYSYDFCWIATSSAPWRNKIFAKLYNEYKGNGLWTNIVNEELNTRDAESHPMDSSNCILMKNNIHFTNEISIHKNNIHADKKVIPYDIYKQLHRESRVNISCSGVSKWNYMDGEYFAWNCFNLRQYHNDLDYNPYSPIDGVHWVTFTDDDLLSKMSYYIQNDEERERINDNGHQYFTDGISGGWAKLYADMFIEYMNTGRKEAFGKVII